MTRTKPALILAAAVVLLSSAPGLSAPASKTASRPVAAGNTAPAQKPKAKPGPQTAMVLEGRSALFGPCTVGIGRGLRIRAKFGYTLWSEDSPDRVFMLNAENRAYLRQTPDQWLSWNRRGVPPINIAEAELIDKPSIGGQPCLHYFGYQIIGGEKVKAAEFYCLQKAPCDSKVTEFWCKHYLLPAKYGFPVIVKQRDGNAMSLVLDTKNIRFEPAATVSFDVPKDYKLTKDKADFYFSESGGLSKSDLESFFQQPLKDH